MRNLSASETEITKRLTIAADGAYLSAMSSAIPSFRRPGTLLGLLAFFTVAGCAHTPVNQRLTPASATGESRAVSIGDAGQIHALKAQLANLDSSVREDEARRLAACAIEQSGKLAFEYRVVRPALFHNFLVNVRLKRRGLCYHWAEDLLAQFQALQLATLEPRWGIARAGTAREHNAVIITARGQPFEQGIVLDAWRNSGRLVWIPVARDRYPWEEGELNTNTGPSDATVQLDPNLMR
jgi:hypothetical protein